MKLIDFAGSVAKSKIKVMSGYNGRVLCYQFHPEKHAKIGERKLLSVWAELEVTDSGFGNYCKAIICAYVDGSEEREKELSLK